MAAANDLRKGMAIKYNGNTAIVLDVHHRTPGNLRAFVQAIIRYINTGKSADVRFGSTDKVELVDISRTTLEFSYKDNTGYHFMDPKTYETITLQDSLLADAKDYLVENLPVEVLFTEGRPVQVELPSSVQLKVVEAPGRPARRYRQQRDQARGARNGQDGQRSALYQRRRNGQDRHSHGRLYGPRLTNGGTPRHPAAGPAQAGEATTSRSRPMSSRCEGRCLLGTAHGPDQMGQIHRRAFPSSDLRHSQPDFFHLLCPRHARRSASGPEKNSGSFR